MEQIDYQTVHSGTGSSNWAIRKGQFQQGLSAGVEVVEVQAGDFSFHVFPTRGMGVWQAKLGEKRIGWDSPIRNPVHPAFVNAKSRNGLGWLDGFNELMCRCGLSFNGPPGHDEEMESPVESDLTLHGKVANIPAHSVEFIAGENGEIGVSGVVDETTLFGPQMRLASRITMKPGENAFTVRDQITNLGSASTELEVLYHTNFGSPILEEGAQLTIPASRVVPNTPRSAEGVQGYRTYLAPTQGYTEQVYFFEPLTDANGKSVALLENQSGDYGVSLEFRKEQLPCFSQWKCTQALQDGYVTGLEPGTNFPNFKPFERAQGRVIDLQPGATYEVELTLAVHASQAEVSTVRDRIAEIQGAGTPEICPQPISPYCSVG